MSKRRGLGKGLGALLSTSDFEEADDSTGLIDIPIDQITPNPHQPRQHLDSVKLQELADSISEHGLIQPLIVTQVGTTYQLIAGERRWRASQLAGLESVPAIVKEASPQAMVELALVENIQRADLNPLEEAAAYAQLINDFNLTQEQVAERVGKSRTAVANTLRLINLSDEAKDALTNGNISEGHARALLSLKEPDGQQQALTVVIEQGLNVRQTEALVRQMAQGKQVVQQHERKQRATDPELNSFDRTMLDMFESILGTKVELSRNEKDQGKIVIHFYSQEELQAIFDAILGKDEQL